jgi:hypothetical protein
MGATRRHVDIQLTLEGDEQQVGALSDYPAPADPFDDVRGIRSMTISPTPGLRCLQGFGDRFLHDPHKPLGGSGGLKTAIFKIPI